MSKFYIYAGGRWCEVETRCGRVEGFRERARFCYVRSGRLHAARSAPVLRALRALATGAPGAARDAAPLPQRRIRPRRRSRRARPSTLTHHCCAHAHAGCQGIATQLVPPITPVSPILPAPPRPTVPQRKRRRISSSEETPVITKSPDKPNTPLKRQKVKNTEKSDRSSDEEKQQVATRAKRQRDVVVVASSSSGEPQMVLLKSPTKQNARTHAGDSSSGDEDQARGADEVKSNQRSPKKLIVNLVLSSDDMPAPTLPPVKQHNRVTRQNIAKVGVATAQRSLKIEAQLVDSSSDAGTKKSVRSAKNLRAPQGKSEVITDAQKLVQTLLESTSDESSGSSQTHVGAQPRERCKELIIGESDVNTLRRYLARTGSGRATLSRFDNDERYKIRIFHRLNPLVTLERCQPLEKLLRQRVTLKEFARNLGLRSVADVTPEKRYKMRRSARKPSVTGDSETDKENVVKPKKRKLWNNDKALFSVRSSRSSEVRPNILKPAVNRGSSRDTSDSDTEFKRRVREQLKKKSISKSRDSLTDAASRRTRSTGRASKDETDKLFTSSVNGGGNSAKMEKKVPEKVVRQTRKSGKISAKPSTFKESQKRESDTDKMKLKLARVSQSMEESEWEVVTKTGSSNAGAAIPVRTLKEQNNDSENEFQTSKGSPKKGNLIRKGKPLRDKGSPFKRKDSNKVTDKDSGQKPGDTKASVVQSTMAKPIKFKKSSVANGREYTSLEDHAIVAWVSTGGRERLVNGNRLWRQLAQEYHRLTGKSRSWHSLRNRYLRYVLPALPALALPPAQVSRLRAAAATGEIKSKSHRRNSIFAAPAVRSASARRAAPAPASPPAPRAPPAPASPPAPRAPPAPAPPARRTRSAGGPATEHTRAVNA